jgi:hypothetical protein
VYEVSSVNVVSAEFITPKWLRAHQQLDLALRVVVAGTLEAPGPEKREHLQTTLSHAARAFETMVSARETEAMRVSLTRVAPRARLVHLFARRVAADWGAPLRQYARALSLEPTPALPPEPEPIDALSILDSSASPGEFVETLVEKHGEESLAEWLFYSQEEGRSIRAWEVEGASPDLFAELKEGARKALTDRLEWEAARKKAPSPPETWDLSAWGVRLRPADADTCAKALVLRATVVEEVLPGGSPVGLRKGDLIVDYTTLYDIVMGGTDFGRARALLERRARGGGSLRVIRGGEWETISVPKPES